MFYLSRRIGIDEFAAVLASLLFLLSIALSALGLSVAAIPAVVYLSQKAADNRLLFRHYLLLFLLG
jgi:hypothetical protein